MAKPPRDIPTQIGARVMLRANAARTGVLTELSSMLWCRVKWDDGVPAPKIVHQYELRTATA
jgi:hypothetical protein